MIDTSSIPSSDYVRQLHHHSGSTQNIIDVIIQADKRNDTRFCEFARQFEPTKAGLKKLWKFTRHKITYKTDAFGTQDIKFPAALWKVRKGDCKSKTLFINQVLKCLGIDYVTRFVKFDNGDYTHVYSIAILNNQRIILDSVYNYFNKEAPYSKELDFMTRISTIEGHRNKIGTTEAEDIYFKAQEEALKNYEEIQQRKQFVQPEQPINFATVSEGEALLELLIRKLKIIGAMKDEQRATTEKGIGLIRNSIKTGKVSGVIPDELQGVAERINYYFSLNGSAVGHGYRGKALEFYKRKAINTGDTISGAGINCLASLWWKFHRGAGTTASPYIYQQYATNPPCMSNVPGFLYRDRNSTYFFYGRDTEKFRTSYFESEVFQTTFTNIVNDVVSQYPGLITSLGNLNYNFANSSVYDAMIEELKQRMPVLSNWANDLYRADNTRVDGTIGTGVLYNFVPYLNQIAAITPGSFPNVVQTKMVFQQQYIDSCVNFSTISRTIFEDMAENGVLFDNGGQTPERILSALLQQYNPNIGLAATAVTLIVGLITAALTATPAIIAACNGGADDASKIDSAAKDTANFRTQSQSTLPNIADFTPLQQTGGGNNGGSSNGSGGGSGGGGNTKKESSIIPWLILGGGSLYVANKNKKKN